MPSIRPPAVAGRFYPGSPRELKAMVEGLLAQAGPAQGARPKAVIAPHAGYVYSGPTAAVAFRELAAQGTPLRRIVLLGPAHYVPVEGLALPGAEAFATPLGLVEVDAEAVEAVARLPQVSVFPEAHAPEHSLEVELPFLQILFPEARVLPLLVGHIGGEEVAEVLELVWGEEDTAIVISSDLSHYLSYDAALRTDGETTQEILALRGPLRPVQACGAYPINGLLVAARRRGLVPQALDLRNSGDTAGDLRRVVGYGAFGFGEAA
jgi:AmmeMemoRadiSam system protein B